MEEVHRSDKSKAMDKGSVLEIAAVYERNAMHASKSVGSDPWARSRSSESSSVTHHSGCSTVEATTSAAVATTSATMAPASLRERCGCAV
jgi:hypothetical protein